MLHVVHCLCGFVCFSPDASCRRGYRPVRRSVGLCSAYSHIYVGSREQPFLLTITLSIRNIDSKYPITITRADYYETQGKLLKKYINTPVTLKPLESLRYVVNEKDKSGGSGANFIVTWEAAKPVNPPIVETIMIGAQSNRAFPSPPAAGKLLFTNNRLKIMNLRACWGTR